MLMSLKTKVAIIGANGMLATMVVQRMPLSCDLFQFDLPELDITSQNQVDSVLSALRPQIIINCAAYTQVDKCETERDLAFAVNGDGPAHLAAIAAKIGAILVHVSTDFVFSGDAAKPYHETDIPDPLSVYGASKLAGEQAIINSDLNEYYIIRTSWLYGPNGANFVETIIRLAQERDEMSIVADQTGTPTYTGDLADAIRRLVSPTVSPAAAAPVPYGIYHYSNGGVCSWYEFATEIIRQLREFGTTLRVENIEPITTQQYPLPARRPPYSVLSKEKIVAATGIDIPLWQQSLSLYLKNRN